jgi:hypothetical protein
MDLPVDEAQLGYRWSIERRRDPAHQLLTAEDLAEAFQRAIELSNEKRRRKKIVMEIIDLVSLIAW